MEEVEINECDCKFCYYGVYDCENSCPQCDIEVKEELNGKENKIETPKFYLYEYIEECKSFNNLGKFTIDDLPKIKIGNKVYTYFDTEYDSALKMFNKIILSE